VRRKSGPPAIGGSEKKMKFVDDSQKSARALAFDPGAGVGAAGVLCVRLYLLQIVNGTHYAEIAENQRIRLLPIPAPRGAILDRNGDQLVDSRQSIALSSRARLPRVLTTH